ncbi:aromatic ring-hydroxylating dioxygenase subunit alpha [Oxalobacteraceae bacterium OTU3CAMAD1]|nr:aromatic ring-hydroxylating dioxygenase subunit alpha [Oxalobacteraceae bacterium OTU3CAMAD1]
MTIDPVLFNDWHPVALSARIVAGVITATDLLDTRIALWRDSAGNVHAWEDRCPHRGTRLSMGAIDNDTLRCAYHGWRFDGEGRCRHIPALPALEPDKLKARVGAFHAQEKYGMVWVCTGSPSESPANPGPPRFPEFADERLRKVWCGPYDVQSSGPRIVENFLDMAHFAFVHDGILGVPEQAAIPDYTVEPFDDAGYGSGVWARQCRAWQPQASKAATGGSDIEYTYRVVRPLTAILTKHPPGGIAEAIALLPQPLTETTTRVWIIMALNDFTSDDDALRGFQDTIFLQDLPILESQSPARLPLIPGAEVSVACDRMSLAYRNYLKRQNVRYGVLRED